MQQFSYGSFDEDYLATFAARDDEGPMWALNLMKYRAVAEYADGRETTKSGLEADNEYSPMAQLAALGARVVLVAPVTGQLRGDDTVWDRIAVVRYPTRRAILDLGQMEDYQRQHEHKEAGMDRTIVAASFPTGDTPDPSRDQLGNDQRLLLQLVADAASPDLTDHIESTHVARFTIEGNIIGDGRAWAEARWDVIDNEVAQELLAKAGTQDDRAYAIVMDPMFNGLATSLAEPSA